MSEARRREHPEGQDGAADAILDLTGVRAALDAGQLGVWAWDLRANRLAWSTNLTDVHGPAEHNVDGVFFVTLDEPMVET